MNKREARAEGLHNGYSIARENAGDAAKAWLEGKSDADDLISAIVSMAGETEQDQFRQFSPFEHFAHALNECGDRSEGLWEAYETGVYDGAVRAAKKFAKSDDGILMREAGALVEELEGLRDISYGEPRDRDALGETVCAGSLDVYDIAIGYALALTNVGTFDAASDFAELVRDCYAKRCKHAAEGA